MVGKRIRDYVKYTFKELEEYTRTKDSCVKKITKPIHINFPPYAMGNFKENLLRIIAEQKIGFYDDRLEGIVLDIRKIKVLTDTAAFRFDDPTIHLNLMADCYLFQPKIGAVIRGLVKHVSARQIGVIIYRVFSVSIQLDRIDKSIRINSEIEFRIVNFDLQNVMPYIKGELIAKETCGNSSQLNINEDCIEEHHKMNRNVQSSKRILFKDSSNDSDSGHESERTDIKPGIRNVEENFPEENKVISLGESSDSDMFAGLYSQENPIKSEMLSPNRSVESSFSRKRKRKELSSDSKRCIENEEENNTLKRAKVDLSAITVKKEKIDEEVNTEKVNSQYMSLETSLSGALKKTIKIEKDVFATTSNITKDDSIANIRIKKENRKTRTRSSSSSKLANQTFDKLDTDSEDMSDLVDSNRTNLTKLNNKSHDKKTNNETDTSLNQKKKKLHKVDLNDSINENRRKTGKEKARSDENEPDEQASFKKKKSKKNSIRAAIAKMMENLDDD